MLKITIDSSLFAALMTGESVCVYDVNDTETEFNGMDIRPFDLPDSGNIDAIVNDVPMKIHVYKDDYGDGMSVTFGPPEYY